MRRQTIREVLLGIAIALGLGLLAMFTGEWLAGVMPW